METEFRVLKEAHEAQERNRPLWTKFLETIAHQEFRYQREYFLTENTQLEVLARKKAKDLLKVWKRDFLELLWKAIEKFRESPTKKQALREYCYSQMNAYMYEVKKGLKEMDGYSFLMQELTFFAKERRMKSVILFLQKIYPNYQCTIKSDKGDLKQVIQKVIQYQLNQFNQDYNEYFQESLNNKQYPCPKKDFIILQAINWMNTIN